jgi:phosphoribosylglycinamide formyltransferase-1
VSGKRRTAILISGRGSNMRALIEAAQAADSPAEIALVLSNVESAGGLAVARALGVPITVISHKAFASRAEFDTAVDAAFRAANIELVCQAGFMRIQTEDFTRAWEGRMLNIHPSLLPAFKGLHVQQQALDAGVKVSGCTVHFVTAELDSGPIIAQAAVPVLDGDTADTLAARILVEEHRIYPQALRDVAAGKVVLRDGRAVFL